MLQFIPLGKEVTKIKKYLINSPVSFCDISLGVKYMWREDFKIEYAVYNDTLILKETCRDYENAFYYPMGKDVCGALKEIEKYCKESGTPLIFCYLDEDKKAEIIKRYPVFISYFLREWSDYIYPVSNFLGFAGKKLSGQRNHVNKFKKLYPDYSFKVIERSDVPALKTFLGEFEEKNNLTSWSAVSEEKAVADLLENSFDINCFGGMMKAGGKIVAMSIGEIVGDTLIVHVEKGLKEYEGVYPTMAEEFATHFCGGNVKYINREEDCGDEGLKTSKMQYHPSEIKNKNIVKVYTAFDGIKPPVKITTERLVIRDFFTLDTLKNSGETEKEAEKEAEKETEKEILKNLFTDPEINRYWGYDYKQDLNGDNPDGEHFYKLISELKKLRQEYYFAVTLGGKVIGDLVLHGFTFSGEAEIGVRFFKKYQGKGYAFEATSALVSYAFNDLGVKKLNACCYKENVKSARLIKKLNFKFMREDTEKYYYSKSKGENKMKLANVFCNNVVLQANKPVRIFGNGDGEGVIEFDGKEYPVKSENGYFEAIIEPHKYGGPYEIKATLNGEVTEVKNVMVGEVILCAGQSNMQWDMGDGKVSPDAPKGKTNHDLRIYITKRLEANPRFDSSKGWVECDERTIESWTAIGYYLAEMINAKYGCAVGVLCCYQGASNIHTWIPRARTLMPDLKMENEKDLYKEMEFLYFDWNTPGTCYEYQFKPVAPFTVSNVFWYQGCSSTNAAAPKYDKLLKALVEEWRKDLKENVPFVIFQLHDFPSPALGRIKDEWLMVQKAQEEAPKYIDNCICVKTADLCEHTTIHPVNKYPVAKRAFEAVYGK